MLTYDEIKNALNRYYVEATGGQGSYYNRNLAAMDLFGGQYPNNFDSNKLIGLINKAVNGEDMLDDMVKALIAMFAFELGFTDPQSLTETALQTYGQLTQDDMGSHNWTDMKNLDVNRIYAIESTVEIENKPNITGNYSLIKFRALRSATYTIYIAVGTGQLFYARETNAPTLAWRKVLDTVDTNLDQSGVAADAAAVGAAIAALSTKAFQYGDATGIDDLDNMTGVRFYNLSVSTAYRNTPYSSESGGVVTDTSMNDRRFVIDIKNNAASPYHVQLFVDYTKGTVFARRKEGGTWYGWSKIGVHKDDLVAAKDEIINLLLTPYNLTLTAASGYLDSDTLYEDSEHETEIDATDGEFYYDYTTEKVYLYTASADTKFTEATDENFYLVGETGAYNVQTNYCAIRNIDVSRYESISLTIDGELGVYGYMTVNKYETGASSSGVPHFGWRTKTDSPSIIDVADVNYLHLTLRKTNASIKATQAFCAENLRIYGGEKKKQEGEDTSSSYILSRTAFLPAEPVRLLYKGGKNWKKHWNSLEAFEEAGKDPHCWGMIADVRCWDDGNGNHSFFCMHDSQLDSQTTGSGYVKDLATGGTVEAFETALSAIKYNNGVMSMVQNAFVNTPDQDVDPVGSGNPTTAGDTAIANGTIAYLDDFLKICRRYKKIAVIETKGVSTSASAFFWTDTRIIDEIMSIVDKYGMRYSTMFLMAGQSGKEQRNAKANEYLATKYPGVYRVWFFQKEDAAGGVANYTDDFIAAHNDPSLIYGLHLAARGTTAADKAAFDAFVQKIHSNNQLVIIHTNRDFKEGTPPAYNPAVAYTNEQFVDVNADAIMAYRDIVLQDENDFINDFIDFIDERLEINERLQEKCDPLATAGTRSEGTITLNKTAAEVYEALTNGKLVKVTDITGENATEEKVISLLATKATSGDVVTYKFRFVDDDKTGYSTTSLEGTDAVVLTEEE